MLPQIWNIRNKDFPSDAVYIGRSKYGIGEWGNPFRVEKYGRSKAISLYEDYIVALINNGDRDITELEGKDLLCWCVPLDCHGNVLLRLANPV